MKKLFRNTQNASTELRGIRLLLYIKVGMNAAGSVAFIPVANSKKRKKSSTVSQVQNLTFAICLEVKLIF